jgi:predicted negative regulator of RcsB-dependent stress response
LKQTPWSHPPLLSKGDKKDAMINYEKAYQMDPTNTAARDIAKKLKSEQ